MQIVPDFNDAVLIYDDVLESFIVLLQYVLHCAALKLCVFDEHAH
jgi:hypothetical protein